MRIGISVCSSYYKIPDARTGAQHMVERAAAANAAGLDTLFVGDHHSTQTAYFQNVPMLARMLAEWREQPAGALFLLPLWNPVLLAEQIGTLAAIAPGRFILQCALGGIDAQSRALGVDFSRRVGMFEAALEVMRALWRGETVRESRYWNIDDACISPVPAEPVEVWIGAQATPAVRRAARMGEGWLASPSLTLPQAAQAVAEYRQSCAEFGRTPTSTAIRKDICLAPASQAARAAVEQVVQRGYRGMDADALVIGSVDEAVAHFGALEDMGYTDVIVRNISQDQSTALTTIECLAEVRRQLQRAS